MIEVGQVWETSYGRWTVLTETIAGWWCFYECGDITTEIVLPEDVLTTHATLVQS